MSALKRRVARSRGERSKKWRAQHRKRRAESYGMVLAARFAESELTRLAANRARRVVRHAQRAGEGSA